MKQSRNVFLIVGLVIFHMVLSMLWYGAFTEQWLEMSRITEEQARGISPITYIIAIISAAVSAYGLLWLFEKLKIDDPVEGAKAGLLIGICFFMLELITQDMFSVRPLKLSLINGGNYLIFLLVAGAVLGGWRKK